LLICTSIIPTVPSDTVKTKRIIYVDDDAVPPYDGTPEHPYKTIQDGINNSVNGDIVYVYSGLYREYVVVDKSITLKGEDRNTTIIDGEGERYGCNIAYINISIREFTFINCKKSIMFEWDVYEVSDYWYTISNNIFINNTKGIHTRYRQLSTFPKNITITNNQVLNNSYGIICQSIHNDISNNIISGNEVGVHLFYGLINTVSHNTISNNTLGIFIEYEAPLDVRHPNTVTYNNFIDNDNHAYFELIIFFLPILTSLHNNKWSRNYWSGEYKAPYPIIGKIYSSFTFINFNFKIQWINFDWLPARGPYDISI
jgi:parallel beta-helix repeat protein